MLSKKILKIKKLQRLGKSQNLILIPKNWCNEMDWDQETKFMLEWMPGRKRVVITEYEEVSKPQPEEHRESVQIGEESIRQASS